MATPAPTARVHGYLESSPAWAFLPRGVPHTYLFTSDTAEIITVCNPAGMEEFSAQPVGICRVRNRRIGPSTLPRYERQRRPADSECSAHRCGLTTKCRRPTSTRTELSARRANEAQHQLGNPLRPVELQEVSGTFDDGNLAAVRQRCWDPVRESCCHATVVASM